MLAWTVREFGPYRQALQLEERPLPEVPAGSVLVRGRAAGINFPDLLMIAGRYQVRPGLPFTPGFEAVGEVAQVTNGARLAVGDRVLYQVEHGAFGEYQSLLPAQVFAVPPGMSDAEAAGFLLTFQTAWFALVHRARLLAGETLLVHGGAGGVGSAAIQLGRALGATVIATAGGAAKLEVCRRLGAHHALDSTAGEFAAAVRELTEGRGADVILDPVGGDVFDQSTRCIAWEGRLLPIGFAGGRLPSIAANRILLKNIAVIGLYWTTYSERAPEQVREAHDRLAELYRRGEIRPLVHEEYPLAELPRALDAVAERRCCGKAVLRLDGDGTAGKRGNG